MQEVLYCEHLKDFLESNFHLSSVVKLDACHPEDFFFFFAVAFTIDFSFKSGFNKNMAEFQH